MPAKKFKDSYDILHAASLYTTPAGLVGRRVTVRIKDIVFASLIVSTFIEGHTMTLGLTLPKYGRKRLDGLVFNAMSKTWHLKFVGGSLVSVDYVEVSAT
jgi:hypothetical protein